MESFYTAKRACLLTMLVWLLALSATYAQSTVTDENNQPMPGVSIKVKGSKNGGTTNTNGKFFAENTDNTENYSAALRSQFGTEVDGRDQIMWLLK